MSYPAKKYSDKAFNTVWRNADPNRGIKLATLYHHAIKNGWAPLKNNLISTTSLTGDKDILNGRLYARANVDRLLFIFETGDVLQFEETGWSRVPYETAYKAAIKIVDDLQNQADKLLRNDPKSETANNLLKQAKYSSTAQKLEAMIKVARSLQGMSVSLSDFDSDPWLLGVQNGILDLRQRTLLMLNPNKLVSKRTNVEFDPDASCPLFIRFLDKIQADKDVRRVLRQLAGIWLTGEPKEQKLIFFYGCGANGKTTFIELMAWLLGDYTQPIQTEMLMPQKRNSQSHSADILALKGCRLAYCNEVGEGGRLADDSVKRFTGMDSLSARAPHAKEAVVFKPSHNLVMIGNHKPTIIDMSHGMWRRLLLIPFETLVSEDEQDPNLLKKLQKEGPGILNWALTGLQDYHKNGLQIPQKVQKAINEYKSEEDIIGQWIEECCDKVASVSTLKGDLYRNYRSWAIYAGHHPLAQGRFTRRLRERGYIPDGKRKIFGLRLMNDIYQLGSIGSK